MWSVEVAWDAPDVAEHVPLEYKVEVTSPAVPSVVERHRDVQSETHDGVRIITSTEEEVTVNVGGSVRFTVPTCHVLLESFADFPLEPNTQLHVTVSMRPVMQSRSR
jgi:hypothetical protein